MDTGGGSNRLRQQTIMVVDDNDGVRAVTRYALETFGFRVVEATDGEEAVKLAPLELPDLILMDLSMPALDGFAAMQRIHSLIGLHDVPVIIVSAHTSPKLRADALGFGCRDFITKPVQLETLKASVERYISTGESKTITP
jgi:CheY-like chemotaxis protein